MRLTAYTNYSLRVLMYCAIHPNSIVKIHDIAADFGISRAHLLKAVSHMAKLGFLSTIRGRNGGIQLGQNPDTLSVGTVVRSLEEQGDFVECFNADTCHCPIDGTCKLTGLFRQGLEDFYRRLDKVTLADIVGDGSDLLAALGRDQIPLATV